MPASEKTLTVKVQNFDSLIDATKNIHNFWTDLLTTGIGAFAGAFLAFCFGYLLYLLQERRAKRKAALEERAAHIMAIKYALVSFIGNFDTLLVFKKRFVLPFKDDVKRLLEVRPNGVGAVAAELPNCRELFNITPKQVFFEITAPEKLHFISDKPRLLVLFHKAREAIGALNNLLESRNQYIWQHMNNATPDGIRTSLEIKRMLDIAASFSEGLGVTIDGALALLRESINNLRHYAKEHYKGEKFPKFDMPHEFRRLLPPKDFIKDNEYYPDEEMNLLPD